VSKVTSSRPGFPEYEPKDLDKINAMRVAKTQPDFHGIPIIHDQAVTFTRGSEMGNRPASCYICALMNSKDSSCMLIGQGIKVEKVVIEGIEYWPRCNEFASGEPHEGTPYSLATHNPDTLGLIWINAPDTGQKYGGSNCGGGTGGDDCDHYMVESGKKWDNPSGFCRVLQHQVDNLDYCAAWWDDDILDWEEAQNAIKGTGEGKGTRGDKGEMTEHQKRNLAKDIIGRK
jgi:hypothetical protein